MKSNFSIRLLVSLIRRLAARAVLIAVIGHWFSGIAHAGVYLSAVSFPVNNLPYVWTDESMPSNYRLRVKLTGVPGYGDGFHAANALNNNWTQLDACPPIGHYWMDIYWVTYDATGTNVTAVGPAIGCYIDVHDRDTTSPALSTAAFGFVGPRKQAYYIPAGVNCVVITAWGGGGSGPSGGNGGLLTAAYNVTPGDRLEITVGGGGGITAPGWPGGGNPGSATGWFGGGYSRVDLPAGSLWAGAGGGASAGIFGGDGGGNANGMGRGSAGGGPGGGGATQTAGGGGGVNPWGFVGKPGTSAQGGDGYAGSGAGGGGAGYFGGGGGAPAYAGYTDGGGGGGSSVANGASAVTVYTTAKNGGVNQGTGPAGGAGGVVIRAFHIQGASFPVLISETESSATVSFPSSAYVVAKVWGAGGGSGGPTFGGAGAYVLGVLANARTVQAAAGWHGDSSYAGADGGRVSYAYCTNMWSWAVAGAGGGGGTTAGGDGGAAGPNGHDGGGGVGNSGGRGGSVDYSPHYPYGYGGAGGQGTGTSGGTVVGFGATANDNPDTNYQGTFGGDPGGWGDSIQGNYALGGHGGSGFAGGGGGGSGDVDAPDSSGGGGGGGGSSAVYDGTGAMINLILAGSGSVPPATNDPDYPGGNVGRGATPGTEGGGGAVVLLGYAPGGVPPVLVVNPSQSFGRGHSTDLAIGATNGALFYSATGLPPGLSLDPISGHVTGAPSVQGAFTSTIKATNPYGTGQVTVVWTITAPDTSLPSTPTGLQAIATSLTTLTLSWSAATDNVSIYGYELQQDGLTVGIATSTTFSLSGLAPNSTHSYKVRSRDPAENWSAWSAPVTITLSDQIPPSAPSGLNYADATATTVTLIWRPATDNVGVTGYTVFRNGQPIGSTSELVFVDSGLTASTTYTYTVTASDAAGNGSNASTPFGVTTTQDFSADADHDSVPDMAEAALGTNTASAGTSDSTNQTQQNIHRPLQ
jgi:chitodextrinase